MNEIQRLRNVNAQMLAALELANHVINAYVPQSAWDGDVARANVNTALAIRVAKELQVDESDDALVVLDIGSGSTLGPETCDLLK